MNQCNLTDRITLSLQTNLTLIENFHENVSVYYTWGNDGLLFKA